MVLTEDCHDGAARLAHAHISSAAPYNAGVGAPDAGVRISKRIVNMGAASSGVWTLDRTRRAGRSAPA